MKFGLNNLFKKKNKDTVIFQVCEDFVEVGVIRALDRDTVSGSMLVEQLYSGRLPRVKLSKKTEKKLFDDLARQVEKLADTVMIAEELKLRDFSIGNTKIVCILADSLSVSADVTHSIKLKKQTKITTELLKKVLQEGEVVKDNIGNVEDDYAVYKESLSNVILNGYDTRRPLGKKAISIDIIVIKYMIIPELWSAIGSVIERIFNREIIYIHKSEIVELDDNKLYEEIYTVDELQAIANDIL